MRQTYLRLSLYNGLLIGLALALGVWAPEAVTLRTAHVRLLYPSLALGGLALAMLGGLAGWLSSLAERAVLGGLVWIAAASLMTAAIGHLPYDGRSLVIWVVEPRFWGLPIYPFETASQVRLLMAGFFIVFGLTVLGLIQPYRLEGVRSALNADNRLSARAWFRLALPVPLVIGAGLMADDIVNRPLRVAPQLVAEAINTGRTYAGDLFALSLERGLSYTAIAGVRQQMSANYSLQIGKFDLNGPTVFVLAHFDNGALINCRIVNNQLSYCYDANPPYLRGFLAALTDQSLDDCRECRLNVSGDLRAWLQERSVRLGDRPVVAHLAQWGSYSVMRAESADGDYAIECLFHGLRPVSLQTCTETIP